MKFQQSFGWKLCSILFLKVSDYTSLTSTGMSAGASDHFTKLSNQTPQLQTSHPYKCPMYSLHSYQIFYPICTPSTSLTFLQHHLSAISAQYTALLSKSTTFPLPLIVSVSPHTTILSAPTPLRRIYQFSNSKLPLTLFPSYCLPVGTYGKSFSLAHRYLLTVAAVVACTSLDIFCQLPSSI